jgi:hypothetical protein
MKLPPSQVQWGSSSNKPPDLFVSGRLVFETGRQIGTNHDVPPLERSSRAEAATQMKV